MMSFLASRSYTQTKVEVHARHLVVTIAEKSLTKILLLFTL